MAVRFVTLEKISFVPMPRPLRRMVVRYYRVYMITMRTYLHLPRYADPFVVVLRKWSMTKC